MASAHGWLPTSLLWDSWGRGPENLWLQLSLFSLLSAAGGFRRQGRREPFRKLLQPDQPVGRQLLLLLRRDRHHNHRWALPHSEGGARDAAQNNRAVIGGGGFTSPLSTSPLTLTLSSCYILTSKFANSFLRKLIFFAIYQKLFLVNFLSVLSRKHNFCCLLAARDVQCETAGLLNSPLAATSDILEELFMKPLPKVSFSRSKNALKGKLEHVSESRKSWLFLNPKFTYSYLKAFVLYYSHCHLRNYAWILLWIQAAVLIKQSFYDMMNKQTSI